MKKYIVSSLLFLASLSSVRACDTCGCEFCDPSLINGLSVYGNGAALAQSYFFASVAEQYTDYGRLINLPAGASLDQYLRSSITQFVFGCQINDRLGVQVNLPYIYRSYRIMSNDGTATYNGQTNGPGDMSVVLNYVIAHDQLADWGYSWRVSGGVKLPTGDAGLLDLESPTTTQVSPLNGDSSAVGGHDVALGSGSVDGIIATGFNVNWQRAFLTADADYAIRGTGRADYRYANELSWSAGPGYRLIQNDNYSLSLQLLATGEYKGADTVGGTVTDDTASKTVSLGPKVLFTWNNHFTANVALEVPVAEHYDTGFQAIPAYRIKAGITFRF